MHILRTVSAFGVLVSVAGCYPPTQTQYNPAVVETPQPVAFFQGTLIDARPATFNYGTIAGIGAAIIPSYRNFVGLAVGGNGSAAGIGAAIPGLAVLAGGVVPELPATEYTVCLDRGTYPASPGAPATIIVVQNVYADRYPNDVNMAPPTPVWVRVVGNSGRVMRRIAVAAPAPLVQPQAPADASCLSAGGPMPVPLQGAPALASLPPVESYGYRQALGQALYQHWTIEP
jgi:hypothetical protein